MMVLSSIFLSTLLPTLSVEKVLVLGSAEKPSARLEQILTADDGTADKLQKEFKLEVVQTTGYQFYLKDVTYSSFAPRVGVLRALAKVLETKGKSFRMDDLPPETSDQLRQQMGLDYQPHGSSKALFTPVTYLQLRGADGRTITLNPPIERDPAAMEDAMDSVRNAPAATPAPLPLPLVNPPKSAAWQFVFRDTALPRIQTKAIKEFGEKIDELAADAETEFRATCKAVASKLTDINDGLTPGQFATMSPATKDALTRMVGNSAKALGFSDDASALKFLRESFVTSVKHGFEISIPVEPDKNLWHSVQF